MGYKTKCVIAFLDHDGVYEIKCCQYTSLYGHSDFVGSAVSFLKYDKEKSAFIICDAYFEAEKNIVISIGTLFRPISIKRGFRNNSQKYMDTLIKNMQGYKQYAVLAILFSDSSAIVVYIVLTI